MKKRIIVILFVCWIMPAAVSANQADLREILSEVEAVRSEIQKSTASLLLIAKQVDQRFGRGRTVQQREVTMTVQFGVFSHRS